LEDLIMTDFQTYPALAVSQAMADAVEQAGQATVLVDARRRMPLSGIGYADDLVLTADHGVEREENIRVVLADGREAAAQLAGRDRGSDLALLRVSGGGVTVARSAEREARVGNLVLALGRPDGIQASLGLVTSLGSGLRTERGARIENYIVTDAVPYPGFSGGPLIDLSGAVLGINTSGLVRGASLAIPLRLAWQVADNLAKGGSVRRGYLGIRSQPVEIPSASQTALGRAQKTGLLVVGVEPEGPAAQALMVGDILVGYNDQPVADHDDLLYRVTGDAVGRAVAAEVLRGGQLARVQITAAERKL
jgi:S1-C subfamily serine protease